MSSRGWRSAPRDLTSSLLSTRSAEGWSTTLCEVPRRLRRLGMTRGGERGVLLRWCAGRECRLGRALVFRRLLRLQVGAILIEVRDDDEDRRRDKHQDGEEHEVL